MTELEAFFARIEIIHLPQRTDRYQDLSAELKRFGMDIDKARIPVAPQLSDANQFPSAGVYGNFLSHLDILRRAHADGLESVLVLEDDVIFRNALRSMQFRIVQALRARPWDMVFIGHSIARGLPRSESGLCQTSAGFVWAHCYGVNRAVLPRLIAYLEAVIERPPGHPEGGKMYIDGAYNMFRELNPDVVTLVTSPCMAAQRGSRSSLAARGWHRHGLRGSLADLIRRVRDDAWRIGLVSIEPKGIRTAHASEVHATPWPAGPGTGSP